jgi:hypothetical protein
MTIRSEPAGKGAPVKMRTHCPASILPDQPVPGKLSPTTFSGTGYPPRPSLRTAAVHRRHIRTRGIDRGNDRGGEHAA